MFTRTAKLPGEDFYTPVPTHWLRDFRLTGTAKAVLAYWCSHQVGYEVTIKQTMAEMREGRDAIYAAVKNATEHGYLIRHQARGEDGKLGTVSYTLGPAAYQPTYQRAWGKAAGQTASGFSVSGQAVSGEPAPKKNRVKKIKEKNNTTPAPSAPEPPVVVQPDPVVVVASNVEEPDTTDRLEAAIAEMVELTGWSPSTIRKALLAASESGARPWPLVVAAARLCYTAPDTKSPARLSVNGIWWKAAAKDLAAAQPREIKPRARVEVPEWRQERQTATDASGAARAAARATALAAATRKTA